MPSPSTSLATLRPDLGGSMLEFDLAMDRQGFISHRVLPVFETAKQSGKFGKIPLEQLLQNRDTARAPGSGYSRGTFTFQEESFACEEHGAEEPIDDRESRMYAEYFDAEAVATQRAFDAVLRNAEKRAAALIFNATTWAGASLTTAIGTPWSTIATATPLTDVENAVQKVWDNSGLWPNALVIHRKAFRNARRTAQIVDLVKYNGIIDPRAGNVTAEALAQAFDLEFVIIAGSAKNTANEGQAATLAGIWDPTQAMVCRVAATNDVREPCIGRTLHWSETGSQVGGTVESYRDERVRSDISRVRHDVDEKVLYVEAGHRLTGIG